MYTRLLAVPAVSASLVLMAISGVVLASNSDGPARPAENGPVYVDATEIRYLESDPVQVELFVSGQLPTPCHEPVFEVIEGADALDVWLWSTVAPDAVCSSVLEPVEISIPLGSYQSASLDVRLEGELVGHIDIDSEPGGQKTDLAGAGWSFGMCLGYCAADLVIDGTALTQSGHDREAGEPLYVNNGELTKEGRARVDAVIAALDGVTLDPTYGCPDCADGGAAYLQLQESAGLTRIDMEYGSPPEVLADLYGLTTSMMTALETCRSDDLVEVAVGCTAYEGD